MHLACSSSLAKIVPPPLQLQPQQSLQEFGDVYLSGNIPCNVKPAATTGGNKFAGRKPGDGPSVRKRSECVNADVARCTLGEVLSDIPPDFSQLHYQSQHHGGLK